MKETGWNGSQIAAKLGFSVGSVTKSLTLLTLPEPLQQRVRDGEIPATAAYALARVREPSRQETLAARVASGELTRDELNGAIKAEKRRRQQPRKLRPIRVTAKLENREVVSVWADSLDLHSFVAILEKLLNRAQHARTAGLTLDALLKGLASAQTASPTEEKAA